MTEGLKPIEQKLERRALARLRLFFCKPISYAMHTLIEERLIVCAIGVANDCIFRHNRVNLARPDRSK